MANQEGQGSRCNPCAEPIPDCPPTEVCCPRNPQGSRTPSPRAPQPTDDQMGAVGGMGQRQGGPGEVAQLGGFDQGGLAQRRNHGCYGPRGVAPPTGAFAPEGAFGQGAFGQDAFGQGAFGQGAFGQGAFGQGAFEQGAFGQGAFGQGTFEPGEFGPGDFGQGGAFGPGGPMGQGAMMPNMPWAGQGSPGPNMPWGGQGQQRNMGNKTRHPMAEQNMPWAQQRPVRPRPPRPLYHKLKSDEQFCDVWTPNKDEFLGQGSFGKVVVGYNKQTGEKAALKFIKKNNSPEQRNEILREVNCYYGIQFDKCDRPTGGHPNVVKLFMFFETRKEYILAFECCQESLQKRLDRFRRRLTEDEVAPIIFQVSSALECLHKTVTIHRDMKPDNVLCIHPTKYSPVKICDFGLTIHKKYPSVRGTPGTASYGCGVGTPGYISEERLMSRPENPFGEDRYRRNTDTFSIGAIMYLLLTGYHPFDDTVTYPYCIHCGPGKRWWQSEIKERCVDCICTYVQNNVKLGNLNKSIPEYQALSRDAKDLICYMLESTSYTRPNPGEVIKHRFIACRSPGHDS